MQNYLKVVWGLQEWSDEPVTATDIAQRAGVKLSTVSDAIRKLSTQGLVEHARYGSVALTEHGREHAVAVVRRHRLIETFLVQALDYSWAADLSRALRVADRLEAGMVAVNRGLVSDPAAPFGGVKESGLGREGSQEGLLEYTETKYVAATW